MSFTTPLRYIPLPRTIPLNTWKYHPTSLQETTAASYAMKTRIPIAASPAFSFEIASIVIYIALITLLLVLTVALLVIPREPSSRQNIALLRKLKTSYGEYVCTDYAYSGIRAILRRVYLELRKAFRCPKCTPRELAQLSKAPAITRFAEVYEDVVYGAKTRQDIDEVLKEVEKH